MVRWRGCVVLAAVLFAGGCSKEKEVDENLVETVSAVVSAAAGGKVALPDGTAIDIPPGALAQDTMISVSRPMSPDAFGADTLLAAVQLEPEGLVLASPATLTLRYEVAPDDDDFATVLLSMSDANPVLDVGGEQAPYATHEVTLDPAARTAVASIDHFSWFTLNPLPKLHLAWQLPGKYLKNGDILYALTNGVNHTNARWFPLHVGLFVQDATNDTVIESTIPDEDCTPGFFSGVEKHGYVGRDLGMNMGYDGLLTLCGGHVFMGARRPVGEVSDEVRAAVVAAAERRLGEAYGALWIGRGPAGVSCVELAEDAWESVGVNMVKLPDWMLGPHDQFLRTVPVMSIEAKVGEEVRVPIIGVAYEESTGDYVRGALAGNSFVRMNLEVTADPDVFAAGRAELVDSTSPQALKDIVFRPSMEDTKETVAFSFNLAAPSMGLALKSPKKLFVEVKEGLGACTSLLGKQCLSFGWEGTAEGSGGGMSFSFPASGTVVAGCDDDFMSLSLALRLPHNPYSLYSVFTTDDDVPESAFVSGGAVTAATLYGNALCPNDPPTGEVWYHFSAAVSPGPVTASFSADCRQVSMMATVNGEDCTTTVQFTGAYTE